MDTFSSPVSRSVGTSGSAGERSTPKVARGTASPPAMRGRVLPSGFTMQSVSPAARLASAGAEPAKGTWVRRTPARSAIISMARCVELPMPALP
jgi:hypothetical protein